MKTSRQEKILAIIARESIETQNQLMSALAREGVKSTQATLSRDIRDLHLVKELTPEGTYRYAAGGKDGVFDHDTRLKKIFRECVVSYAVAQNLEPYAWNRLAGVWRFCVDTGLAVVVVEQHPVAVAPYFLVHFKILCADLAADKAGRLFPYTFECAVFGSGQSGPVVVAPDQYAF